MADGDPIVAFLARSGSILDGVRAEAWIKDGGSRFQYANDRFTRSVGAHRNEVIGARDHEFFPRRRIREFRESDTAALSRHAPVVCRESGSRDPRLTFDTIKLPIRSHSGHAVGTVGLAIDISRWLERPIGRCTTVPTWFSRALSLLENGDGVVPTVADVAAAVGVHRNTLGRAFKAYLGIRLSEYRRWLRARRTRDGILHSSVSLSEIATAFGYTDQSHLTTDFARLFGLTPGGLRKLGELARSPPGRFPTP